MLGSDSLAFPTKLSTRPTVVGRKQRAVRKYPTGATCYATLTGLNSSLRHSNFEDSSQPFRRSEDLAKYAEGLRRAGLSES
jgi:hypothetical protein